jgi:hypothetical protein
MSFIAYFIMLIFAGGAALFGLDVLTAPLPPQKPAVQVAGAPKLNRLAEREASQRAMDQGGKPGALTPVYPTSPGEVRSVEPGNPATRAETTGSAPAQDTASSTPAAQTPQRSLTANQTVAVQPSPLQADQTANDPALRSMLAPTVDATKSFSNGNGEAKAAAPTDTPAPTTQSLPAVTQASATQPAGGACNVQACASAYSSFRASDCTYQPYDGPRRACVAPPASQRSAQRTQPLPLVSPEQHASRRVDRDAELREVTQKVREITTRHYSADADDDDDADADTGGGSPHGFFLFPRPQ